MEPDQEQEKHRCKVCMKSFSSGRSLGGHMRSHVHSSCLHVEEKQKLDGSRGQVGLGLGYDLRENPKKTFRLSDFIGEVDGTSWKQCKACGKRFPSWKALFGHMRCHSGRTCPRSFEGEEEASWGCEKVSMESFSDDNEPPPPRPLPKRKRWSKRASPAIASATTGSSSSITAYEPEQEDVAISLMMLSRAAVEFSDKNSGVLVEEAAPDEDSVDDESRSKIHGSTLLRRKRGMLCNNYYPFNGFNVSGSRFQCITCRKSFHSYQALGGHRANHKRIRDCCGENNNFDTEASAKLLSVTEQKSRTRTHECVICGRTFSSGQALGGHKRSHLVSTGGGGRGEHQITEVQKPVTAARVNVPEPLDLNLPAPVDEMSSNFEGLVCWGGPSA